jgi:hypothetical protein
MAFSGEAENCLGRRGSLAHNPKAKDPKKDPKITSKYRNLADLLQRTWEIRKLRSRQWVVA